MREGNAYVNVSVDGGGASRAPAKEREFAYVWVLRSILKKRLVVFLKAELNDLKLLHAPSSDKMSA